MLFNSFPFALFLALLLAMLRLAPRGAWPGVLLGGSLVFYAMWRPPYLVLLLVVIGVNWWLLGRIVATRPARGSLIASIVFTLGLLGYYKYAALAVESLIPVLSAAGVGSPAIPEIVLPLGISFFSFQIVGLAIDGWRGRLEERPPLARYALFVSFFPQLIAGPILRGNEFLPQLERGAEPSAERTRRGLWLLASGLAKKVLIADFLLAPFVDLVFQRPGLASGPFHLMAIYSFAFQIYFDFSGYTDMARGISLLIGFELPLNFREPYLSRDPSEFWRRWHITLSEWLRDYLYIPLGGNRKGLSRTYLNLLVTMVLGGLWHGAAWNFAIWGGLHGAMLVVHRRFRGTTPQSERWEWRELPRIALLFHFVCLAWVFFRAPSFADALAFIAGFGSDWGDLLTRDWPWFQTAIVALCAALHPLERRLRRSAATLQLRVAEAPWGSAAEGLAFGTILALTVAFSGSGAEFIYFQF